MSRRGVMRESILRAARSWYVSTGVPATVRELAAVVGAASTGSLHYHLSALVESGDLRRQGTKYVPTSPGPDQPTALAAASCPWEGLAHDFTTAPHWEVRLIYCRKCGVERLLAGSDPTP